VHLSCGHCSLPALGACMRACMQGGRTVGVVGAEGVGLRQHAQEGGGPQAAAQGPRSCAVPPADGLALTRGLLHVVAGAHEPPQELRAGACPPHLRMHGTAPGRHNRLAPAHASSQPAAWAGCTHSQHRVVPGHTHGPAPMAPPTRWLPSHATGTSALAGRSGPLNVDGCRAAMQGQAGMTHLLVKLLKGCQPLLLRLRSHVQLRGDEASRLGPGAACREDSSTSNHAAPQGGRAGDERTASALRVERWPSEWGDSRRGTVPSPRGRRWSRSG
jgi:hypothetical protein